jgi:hypothetical protein
MFQVLEAALDAVDKLDCELTEGLGAGLPNFGFPPCCQRVKPGLCERPCGRGLFSCLLQRIPGISAKAHLPELALPAEKENPLARAARANMQIEIAAIGVPSRRSQTPDSPITEAVESSLCGHASALTFALANVMALAERQ